MLEKIVGMRALVAKESKIRQLRKAKNVHVEIQDSIASFLTDKAEIKARGVVPTPAAEARRAKSAELKALLDQMATDTSKRASQMKGFDARLLGIKGKAKQCKEGKQQAGQGRKEKLRCTANSRDTDPLTVMRSDPLRCSSSRHSPLHHPTPPDHQEISKALADAQARLDADRAARAKAKKEKEEAEAAEKKKRDESGYVPCPGALALQPTFVHVPPPTTPNAHQFSTLDDALREADKVKLEKQREANSMAEEPDLDLVDE